MNKKSNMQNISDKNQINQIKDGVETSQLERLSSPKQL